MTADEELRRALRVLHGMSDDLARAVLDGVKPDDIGQPDWEAANDDFRSAFAARSEPRAEGLREGFAGHGSHRPGSVCMECERLAARSEPRAEGLRCSECGQPVGYYHTEGQSGSPHAATPPAEGLDVERLADAFANCLPTPWGEREYAARVAREYAALAPEPPICADCGAEAHPNTPHYFDHRALAPEQPK
jgi:hypothetical protein